MKQLVKYFYAESGEDNIDDLINDYMNEEIPEFRIKQIAFSSTDEYIEALVLFEEEEGE